MRIEVELHPVVVELLRNACTDAEIDDFYRQLGKMAEDVFGHSEGHNDPTLSRHCLHRFRFADNWIAIFHFDPSTEKARVLDCRKLDLPRIRKNDPRP